MIAGQQCRPFDSRFLVFAETEDQEEVYKAYGNAGSIVNEAARKLSEKRGKNVDPSRVSVVVRQIQKRAQDHFSELEWDDEIEQIQVKPLRVFIYDIETAPTEAYVWRYWNENIGHAQVKSYGRVISFAGKWLGTDEIIYEENRGKSDKAIIKKLIKLFDQADVVVAHNGKAFDCKTVTGRALTHNIPPPSPFKIVDTMLSAKRYFKMPRNSLECLADELGCSGKLKHKKFPGFDLWKECMAGNEEAWEEMRIYNEQDVIVLEEVYLRMRPWIADHPNMGILQEEGRPICPKCGSGELAKPKRKHYTTTNTGKYRLYVCRNCGGYARSRRTELEKEKGKSLTVHAV
jgi:DNA polymerase elongation subunit (family B)